MVQSALVSICYSNNKIVIHKQNLKFIYELLSRKL